MVTARFFSGVSILAIPSFGICFAGDMVRFIST